MLYFVFKSKDNYELSTWRKTSLFRNLLYIGSFLIGPQTNFLISSLRSKLTVHCRRFTCKPSPPHWKGSKRTSRNDRVHMKATFQSAYPSHFRACTQPPAKRPPEWSHKPRGWPHYAVPCCLRIQMGNFYRSFMWWSSI